MSEIPEDIIQAAQKAWDDAMVLTNDAQSEMVIAQAIWAERQRNAKIAENEMLNTDVLLSQPPKSSAAFRISKAILNQTE